MWLVLHRTLFIQISIFVILVGTGAAASDWLDDAWSDESVRINGNPAISIQSDSISVVLPTATLAAAYEEGVSTENIVRSFLDRYGQRCSDLIELNITHPNIRVELSLQSPTRFEGIPAKDEVLTTLKNVYINHRAGNDIPLLFTISPVKYEYWFDYVPTRQVHCIKPREESRPTS
jgi:hypothetical protein